MLVVHSSDELYGADRMTLQVIRAATSVEQQRVAVWLPAESTANGGALSALIAREDAGVTVEHHSLPVLRRQLLSGRGLALLLWRMIRIVPALRRHRREHLHLATSALLLLAPLARICGYRRVTVHVQEIWKPRERRILGLLGRSAHAVVCISGAVRDALDDVNRGRAVVIWNCGPHVAETPSWPADALTLVCASRWNAWKGHATLLRALELTRREVRLILLGGPPLLGEACDVAELVARHPRKEHITIVGEVSDTMPFLGRAHAAVVPSDEPEPFGLVAVEAFAAGRPVIASDAGGVAEIVEDGETGWLFPSRDPGALARLLDQVDLATAHKLGEAARSRYEERFTPERYRRLIASTLLGQQGCT